MCGIAGIYSFKNNGHKDIIRSMTNAMAHRGPDADGFYDDDTMSLGHRRLSIIDLSENANQPLYDDTNNYVIIFNGEIYNYKEVKSKLVHYNFKTSSDTEVVLAGFITWGKEILSHLKGMFAFAIYNKHTKDLFIARDRLGVKPIYYYKDENCFIFASEIRAILATNLVAKEIDQNALHTYFATQSFSIPQSIIKNVHQLEAGYTITVSSKNFVKEQYWNITEPQEKFIINDAATAKKEVYRLMLQSVERRLVADVPVAAFLSGGIDSSAIVGLMAQIKEAPQTFNIAFNEKEYDESTYAEIIAQKFNTQHHKILLQPKVFLDELPNALNAMDIPSGDGINSYVVSKEIVKKGIKVAMSGVGGDELFAGYPSFKQWYSINQKKWIWNSPQFLRQFASLFLSDNNNKTARIKELILSKNLSIDAFYPLVRQVFSKKEIAGILRGQMPSSVNVPLSVEQFPLLSQFSIAELTGYTHHTLLKDTDQFSMAVSLEVREPFFDHELIEYVLQIPDHIKYPNYAKQLLVESLEDLLPNEIVHRKKQGFVFPWELWMKNELKEFCETNIAHLYNYNFLNSNYIEKNWNDFLKGAPKSRWSNTWLFVILGHWLNKNNISN
jgi:asparagine synthase (glutamine-hydrolysing)